MAPEQLDPAWGKIGPPTDVFGLGAVLFALLGGRPPCSGRTLEGLLQAMLSELPALSLRAERPEIAPELDAICRKCLSLTPADRYRTASELAQALALVV